MWGCALGGNTYGNVHDAFYRAFKHLGYDAYHVQDTEENRERFLNESDCLYLTIGIEDKFVPIRSDCEYVTHNVEHGKYDKANNLKIQVLVNTIPGINKMEKISDMTYYDHAGRIMYFPWGTNLLPHEFDFDAPLVPKENNIYWVGTIAKDPPFQNIKNIDRFIFACKEKNIEFVHAWEEGWKQISQEKNIELIRKSFMAPTIVGHWQHDVGFVPCRLMKNTSYGQLPVTNLGQAKEIFGDLVVQNDDPYYLFYDALEHINDVDRIRAAMKIVQENHTYINRVNSILKVL